LIMPVCMNTAFLLARHNHLDTTGRR
jgi:hypothetical protein